MVLVIIFFVLLYLWLICRIAKLVFKQKYGVEFICAEIGAGKSCYAVKQALRYLRKGWTVVSNERIDGCYYVPDLGCLERYCFPPNTLVILDESSLCFNSRSFKTVPLALIEYFKMCRHYKNKVILISQTFNDTDKQIRELSSRIYIIKQLFPTKLSMPVRVKSRLDVEQMSGDIKVMYKIGHIGIPYFLPLYYRKFNSFATGGREIVNMHNYALIMHKADDLCKKVHKRALRPFGRLCRPGRKREKGR